jgi:hypothetical protein
LPGDAKTRTELGLGEPSDRRPLYIGKAEDNLSTRDLKTHFGDGRTGQSTVRRSFAALLHDTLGFRGIPRNPAKPAHFSNYGLSPEHDAALTAWMRERRHPVAWEKPLGCRQADEHRGGAHPRVASAAQPRLRHHDVDEPGKAARAVMAGEARTWASRRAAAGRESARRRP